MGESVSAIADSWKQQAPLNIVEIRYKDPPVDFTDYVVGSMIYIDGGMRLYPGIETGG